MPTCTSRCSIYANRPVFCREYPAEATAVPFGLPPRCTFQWINGERTGSCQPEVCQEGACCNYPRVDGEPEGELDFEHGTPCKHLTWSWEGGPTVPEDLFASRRVEYMPLIVPGEGGSARGLWVPVGNWRISNHFLDDAAWSIDLLPAAIPFLQSLAPGDERAVAGPILYRRTEDGLHVRCVSRGVSRYGFLPKGEIELLTSS